VETGVEASELRRLPEAAPLQLRLLGPLTLKRAGAPIALPSSRKVRALIAYLALASRGQTRSHLCELFGDVPSDPRGELRWCLSKARSVLDEPGRRRIVTSGDAVGLDLVGSSVDVGEVEAVVREGIAASSRERLRAVSLLFAGEFLEGLEIDRSPLFSGWLVAQRRRLRAVRITILERLAHDDDASMQGFGALEQWLQLAPLDRRAHVRMLNVLAARGEVREGEEHLAAASRQFEAEGLDWRSLVDAWREAREARVSSSPPQGRVPIGAQPIRSLPGIDAPVAPGAPRKASIAIMPFEETSIAGAHDANMASALVHDIITRLAKLRSLFVIAQGTVFALHERTVDAGEAGRTLDVDYVVGGTLRRRGNRIVIHVELTETRTARVVWAEVFDQERDDVFLVLDEIGNRIVSSVASEIETVERERAILKPPSSLDAWEAYHRGLWHMYRFAQRDNAHARYFFEMAARLDPGFSRAHGGLSFTHWQSAFQGWSEREPAMRHAFESAERSLAADDRDPAAHWSMGRALWLAARQDQALVELDQAVQLSPNFALGHYTLAFVHSQSGDPHAAIASSDQSRMLSPFDPLLFGMLATRAMALVRLGRFEEAADWSVKAAARPNAHAHILGIAAHCLALAERRDEACRFAAAIRKTLPQYTSSDFLAAFRFDPATDAMLRAGASRAGLFTAG
jgi:TolB-like protein/DNA-binding SARP family transcriptional activator